MSLLLSKYDFKRFRLNTMNIFDDLAPSIYHSIPEARVYNAEQLTRLVTEMFDEKIDYDVEFGIDDSDKVELIKQMYSILVPYIVRQILKLQISREVPHTVDLERYDDIFLNFKQLNIFNQQIFTDLASYIYYNFFSTRVNNPEQLSRFVNKLFEAQVNYDDKYRNYDNIDSEDVVGSSEVLKQMYLVFVPYVVNEILKLQQKATDFPIIPQEVYYEIVSKLSDGDLYTVVNSKTPRDWYPQAARLLSRKIAQGLWQNLSIYGTRELLEKFPNLKSYVIQALKLKPRSNSILDIPGMNIPGMNNLSPINYSVPLSYWLANKTIDDIKDDFFLLKRAIITEADLSNPNLRWKDGTLFMNSFNRIAYEYALVKDLLIQNLNLSIDFILRTRYVYNWNLSYLVFRRDLTADIFERYYDELIVRRYDEDIYTFVSHGLTPEFLARHPEWLYNNFSETLDYTPDSSYYADPKNKTFFVSAYLINPTLTEEFMLEHVDTINLTVDNIGSNPNISLDFILSHPEIKWNWEDVGRNSSIKWYDFLKYPKLLNYHPKIVTGYASNINFDIELTGLMRFRKDYISILMNPALNLEDFKPEYLRLLNIRSVKAYGSNSNLTAKDIKSFDSQGVKIDKNNVVGEVLYRQLSTNSLTWEPEFIKAIEFEINRLEKDGE